MDVGAPVSSPVSTLHGRGAFLGAGWVSGGRFYGGVLVGEQALQGAVAGRVVGGVVLPAVPDHIQPRSGQDAHRVRVVFAAGDRGVADLGRPRIGVPGAVGEVADRVAELFADGPAEGDGLVLAGLAGGRRGAGRQISAWGSGNFARQSPISDSSRAARTVPERGSEVKMWPSACAASWAAICASSALIWVFRLASTAARARVTWALAAPCPPVAPRGADLSRS